MVKEYEGEFGSFSYDDEYWEFDTFWGFLRYRGEIICGSIVNAIPDGIKTCNNMFYGCIALEEAPVIPASVETCSGMFADCTNLKRAPIIPNSVKDCSGMFYNCKSLEKAPAIPEGVKTCKDMFAGCISIEQASVDVPASIRDCSSMFAGCKSPKCPKCGWSLLSSGGCSNVFCDWITN